MIIRFLLAIISSTFSSLSVSRLVGSDGLGTGDIFVGKAKREIWKKIIKLVKVPAVHSPDNREARQTWQFGDLQPARESYDYMHRSLQDTVVEMATDHANRARFGGILISFKGAEPEDL